MDKIFVERNMLLRAVWPNFWKKDGTLSSALFKDKKGVSVTCTNLDDLQKSIFFMIDNFKGKIISVTTDDCEHVKAFLAFKPNKHNPYHCEIHGSKDQVILSNEQALALANRAIVQSEGKI